MNLMTNCFQPVEKIYHRYNNKKHSTIYRNKDLKKNKKNKCRCYLYEPRCPSIKCNCSSVINHIDGIKL